MILNNEDRLSDPNDPTWEFICVNNKPIRGNLSAVYNGIYRSPPRQKHT